MAVMPGAHFLDAVRGSTMIRYDVLCVHTIVGYAPANAAHFSTQGNGYVWQSRDTLYRSAANLNGNPRVIAVENEDHGAAYGAWSGSNVPSFTAAQIEALAKICAWAYRTHGIPLVHCPDSKPGSRGVAFHRQGIDGNFVPYNGRVPGGELWSSSGGKVCPGDRRIAQMAQIINRARQLAGLDQENDVDATQNNAVISTYKAIFFDAQGNMEFPTQGDQSIIGRLVWLQDRAKEDAADRAAMKAAIATLEQSAGATAAAAVAAYLAANPPTVSIDYAALAAAVNDDAARRLAQ